MTQISFYVLKSATQQERYSYACKLIEKAYRSGSYCYVLTESDTQSQHLDNLLWTFRPTSFVPHQVYRGTPPDFSQTILIGTLAPPAPWDQVLINLAPQPPANLTQTQRLLEIIDNSEAIKSAGRQRYRYYKQQLGIEPVTHQA